MIEFYPQIKLVHLVAVIASGSLFLIRGALVVGGRQAWALAAPVRYLSYTIDTTLLTAALMLFSMLPKAMFANGWLTLKVALLIPYIVLGTLALKRGRTARTRAICYALALSTFACMFSVARMHHPLGFLRVLG